ncbi:hypothetical protein Y600_5687 [Burkholderia pseudomallei MSHR3709]|nr:hypothetical protein Y600_5687 [Burkholderia pseudomallei MSHR3709]
MVWPSRRHVTFFSNRPRALNHYNLPYPLHPTHSATLKPPKPENTS